MAIKASDILKEQLIKEKNKKKIYKKVYYYIDRKISGASKVNEFECVYEVPEFILGIPLYNLKHCINYINKKLIKNGFKTRWYDNKVHIDWSSTNLSEDSN